MKLIFQIIALILIIALISCLAYLSIRIILEGDIFQKNMGFVLALLVVSTSYVFNMKG